MIDLKKCPFCASHAEIVIGEHNFVDVKIRCLCCSAEGPLFDTDPNLQRTEELLTLNKENAVKHGNTRKRKL